MALNIKGNGLRESFMVKGPTYGMTVLLMKAIISSVKNMDSGNIFTPQGKYTKANGLKGFNTEEAHSSTRREIL